MLIPQIPQSLEFLLCRLNVLTDPILEWKEPVYFLKRKGYAYTSATRVPRAQMRKHWFESVWGAPLFRTITVLGIVLLFVIALLMITSGDYSLSGIVSTLGAGLLIVLFRSYSTWVRSLHPPDLPTSTVRITSDAIVISTGSEPDLRWAYEDIQRAQVGVVKYEEGLRAVLRLKVQGEGWQEVNVAPEVSLEVLRHILRGGGVRVQERIKRWWYE